MKLKDYQQRPPQPNTQMADIHQTSACSFQNIQGGPQTRQQMYVIPSGPNPYIQFQHAAVQP